MGDLLGGGHRRGWEGGKAFAVEAAQGWAKREQGTQTPAP